MEEILKLILQRLDTMDQRFDSIDKRFDGVDQRFDGVDQRFDAVDQRFDGVDQRFDAVDQRFDGVNQQFDAVNQQFDAVNQQFDAVNQQFIDVDKQLKSLVDRVGGLEKGQQTFNTEQSEMRKEMAFYYGSMMKKLDETKVELSSEIKHVSAVQKQHQDVLEILNEKQ